MLIKFINIVECDFFLISSVSCIVNKKCKFFDENILFVKIKFYIN